MSTTAPPSAPQQRPAPAPSQLETAQRESIAPGRGRRARNFGLDTARLRRVRLIVFAVLALPLLILALLAVKFVSMPLTQLWHDEAYDRGDHPTAIQRLEPVWVANWFEPYLPHLTKGTDLLQQGREAEAEKELRLSVQKWQQGRDLNQPKHAQCKILNNLAISIERQADRIEDATERGDRLFEAEELLAPCAGGGGGGDGQGGGGGQEQGEGQDGGNGNEDSETTDGNGERIKEKRREADEKAGKDPDARGAQGSGDQEGGTNAPPPGDPKREDDQGTGPEEEAPEDSGDSPNDPKEDELEKRNKDSQGGDGEDEGGAGSDPEKPW